MGGSHRTLWGGERGREVSHCMGRGPIELYGEKGPIGLYGETGSLTEHNGGGRGEEGRFQRTQWRGGSLCMGGGPIEHNGGGKGPIEYNEGEGVPLPTGVS